MQTKPAVKTLRVTVGDLVVAAMDAALEISKNQRKACRLAGIVLNKMLREARAEAHLSSGDTSRKPLLH